mmetsp:Transcript_14026/g.48264  ORF Transcript_14026/g.48264 Transcript_14026/m.48264 type:complete len:205 (-) Transcript_14026:176-790(-)
MSLARSAWSRRRAVRDSSTSMRCVSSSSFALQPRARRAASARRARPAFMTSSRRATSSRPKRPCLRRRHSSWSTRRLRSSRSSARDSRHLPMALNGARYDAWSRTSSSGQNAYQLGPWLGGFGAAGGDPTKGWDSASCCLRSSASCAFSRTATSPADTTGAGAAGASAAPFVASCSSISFARGRRSMRKGFSVPVKGWSARVRR